MKTNLLNSYVKCDMHDNFCLYIDFILFMQKQLVFVLNEKSKLMKGRNNRIVKEAIMKLEVQNSASCITGICYNNSTKFIQTLEQFSVHFRRQMKSKQRGNMGMYKNDQIKILLCQSLSVNFSHFHLLLHNHRSIFNQTWHKAIK